MGLKRNDLKRMWVERGSIIKRRRASLGWDREELANRAGVQLNFVTLIERGEMDAPYAVDKILEAINEEQYRRLQAMQERRRGVIA